eukprot:GHVU01141789.1.p2 GENE.GHVU01141789.1~~GHVU01141789.1.p2  ORF type:complete len:141 (+),score=8.26 GHVU01141789.1:94-516(+)
MARRMAEAALRNDGGTPVERAHRMIEAAVLMGQAAQRAAETGEVIRTYRGEVRDGRRHGLGVDRRPDGWPNGSVCYEGEWRNGNRHGLGVSRWANGNIGYAGQWQDTRHGLGVERHEVRGSVVRAGWWNRNRESQTAPPG